MSTRAKIPREPIRQDHSEERRDDLGCLADRIERGGPLHPKEREYLARILRERAASAPKKNRGRPPRIDAISVAMIYAIRMKIARAAGKKAQGAKIKRALAKEHRVHIDTIEGAIEKYGAMAASFANWGSKSPIYSD